MTSVSPVYKSILQCWCLCARVLIFCQFAKGFVTFCREHKSVGNHCCVTLLKIVLEPNLIKVKTWTWPSTCSCFVHRCIGWIHGRNLVGDTGDVSPHFFRRGGHNMPCPPNFFLFTFCMWRGFKNKSDVCHVLCEELFMLNGRPHIAKLMLKQSLVWYHSFC